jgi:putative acetyltransferase
VAGRGINRGVGRSRSGETQDNECLSAGEITPRAGNYRPVNPIIRLEAPSDVAAIHAVTAEAFLHAPHTDHTEQFIVDALRRAGALSISLVAEIGSAVVGHVAVSPVSMSDGSIGWFGLGPISVSPDRQRQGIGTLLMQGALRILRERGAAGCVVLGAPSYYSRFGFRPGPDLVLPDVPPEYFQAVSFGPSRPRGVVTYHAAFGTRG